MSENEAKILTNHGDAAGLMLAAADNRRAMAATVRSLTHGEAAELLLSAVEVGGTLVRIGDQNPHATPRELLTAVLASCRSDVRE